MNDATEAKRPLWLRLCWRWLVSETKLHLVRCYEKNREMANRLAATDRLLGEALGREIARNKLLLTRGGEAMGELNAVMQLNETFNGMWYVKLVNDAGDEIKVHHYADNREQALREKLGVDDFDRYARAVNPRSLHFKRRRELELFGKTKIGRNEKCPCGSGKKFKRCCLVKVNGYA